VPSSRGIDSAIATSASSSPPFEMRRPISGAPFRVRGRRSSLDLVAFFEEALDVFFLN
jgi:hypothetical protein